MKDIIGYEGKYKVTREGKVYSLISSSFLTPFKKGDGYPAVILRAEGKRKSFYVHRLVAQAFLPNPDNLPCVNHKDEDKSNPHADNLEWCDRFYNMGYSMAKKYVLTSPCGELHEVTNLSAYCRLHGLSASKLSETGKWRGWRCKLA